MKLSHALIPFVAALLLSAGFAAAEAPPVRGGAVPRHLKLPLLKVVPAPTFYADFCDRYPGDCDLSGPGTITLTPEIWRQLDSVNREVNGAFKLIPDAEHTGGQFEEFWDYLDPGYGDCEDFALEKRRRLVKLGLPRGALRMTTAFHKELLYPHAILLVETSQGTLVLDQESQSIDYWDEKPLMYEKRERQDGRWEVFEVDW
ncbi:MAG: transglutaminase-like cysteine peptidase [Elusimicrobiota bacterium]